MATSTTTAIKNVRDGIDARRKFELIWAECDNFLRSEQNLYRTPDGRLIEGSKIPAVQRKIRHVYNIITARFQREVSIYSSQLPGWRAVPSPPVGSVIGEVGYQSAQQGAVNAERQLSHDYNDLHLARATARAKWLACEFGEGYIWVMNDSKGGKAIGNSGKYTTKNCVKVLDPSQVGWRKGRRFEESDFVFIRCNYTKQETSERYGIPIDKVKTNGISAETFSDALVDEGFADADLVLIYEYFERPTASNPKGLHLTLMGDQELKRGDYPYDFEETEGEQWLIRYVYTQPERQSRGKGMVQDMLDAQRAFNRRMNLLSEWAGIAANPMPVVNKRVADTQRQAVYPGKTWLSEPAFDQGKPISFVEVPSLPDWLASSPNQLTQVQDQITGQIDLQNIASTAAAATVQQMVDQNTASRGDVSRGFNDSDCRLAVRLLCLDRKFYTEPRELTYRSDTGENTLKGFVASRELPRRIDFYIEAGAPKTADQNAAMINNWIAQGWVPPNVGILAIQKNQPELVTDPIEKNVSKQQRENQQIMGISEKELRGVLLKQAKIDAAFASQGVDITEAGPPPGPWPMPNQFDNDEIHMSQMESWFLTPEFELLGPSQQQVALWHYEAHKQAKMQKEMEAQNELNERAAMLGQNNAASAGQDKLLPSQPGIPQSAETQAAPQPVER